MSSDLFEQLRDDIKRGDAIAVRRFLEQGGDPNLHNACGETPLVIAAFDGQTHLAELLLVAGARIDHHVNGWTPLYSAAMNGHQKTVAALLEHGADIHIPMHGEPLTYWLNLVGHHKILELIKAESRRLEGAA